MADVIMEIMERLDVADRVIRVEREGEGGVWERERVCTVRDLVAAHEGRLSTRQRISIVSHVYQGVPLVLNLGECGESRIVRDSDE